MPNRSGKWSLPAQMQAYGSQKWTQPPAAPTIGTATATTNGSLQATVTFTAPSFLGNPPASGCSAYQVVSTPGCLTASGGSSPITIGCLVCGTAYTFKVHAQNAIGFGAFSAASNSATPTSPTCQVFGSAGSYCWVAPSGVTSVSVVAVGGGASGSSSYGGSGGALAYTNSISVTAGCSYAVTVGSGGARVYAPVTNTNGIDGGFSQFINCTTVKAGGGSGSAFSTNPGGTVIAGTGGAGGAGGNNNSRGGGGGAGGYSGAGGTGGQTSSGTASSGSGGGGGGGGGSYGDAGGGGGGVGLYGQGCNGTGGTNQQRNPTGGTAGSGGGNGGNATGGCQGYGRGGDGGYYGAGGGAGYSGGCAANYTGAGYGGAVRIVWCKNGARGTPSFPSTNVGP